MKAPTTISLLFLISTCGTLTSCEPAYHANRGVFPDDCEGYLDAPLDSNTFYISMCGDYYRSAFIYELYRAAELTVASGNDRFVILHNSIFSEQQRELIHHLHANRQIRPLVVRTFKDPSADIIMSFDAHGLLVSMEKYIKHK